MLVSFLRFISQPILEFKVLHKIHQSLQECSFLIHSLRIDLTVGKLPFLLSCEVWWEKAENGFYFFDSDTDRDFHQEGPTLCHFRSHN